MANPFVHIELHTNDIAKAKQFYGALFDWTLTDVEVAPGHTYTMIGVGEGTGGGMMQQMMPGAPPGWLAFTYVEEIKAATEKARSLGAKVMREPMEVMDAGWLSIIVDPTGAQLGLWQPKKKG